MARTRLLRAIERLAAEHHEAEQLAIPPAELRERRAEAVHSRREILKRGGALGVAAIIGPSILVRPAVAAGGDTPRIAIVGAGIAGLNAALVLQDKGLASTVYEAADRVGGRMHSDRSGYWANGQVSEFCGELIDSGHTTILGLANRFGLAVADLLAAEPAGSTETYWFLGSRYSPGQADADFVPVRAAAKKDLTAAGYPTLWNNYKPAGYALDHMSVYDWIETRVPGGHGSAFGRLLDAAYTEEYGAETTDQSSLNIVYLLAYQPGPKGFDVFGVSDERYHIAGGNQQLPEAIAATLPAVRLGWRMTAIATNSDGTVTLSFSTPSGSTSVVADQVLLTTPFPVLRTLDYSKAGFDDLKKIAITQLGRRSQHQAPAAVRQPLLEHERPVGNVKRRLLRRSRLPEHVGRDARPERDDRHPRELQRRQHGGGILPVHALLQRDREPEGIELCPRVPETARDGLPRDHPALERQGDALHPVPGSEPPQLLRVPQGRPVHLVHRIRRRRPGQRSTSPASTARRTSRASWRAAPERASAPRSRSTTP